MTRVLVSGATGFIGRFIVEHLTASGLEVIAGGRREAAPGFFSRSVTSVHLTLDPDIDQTEAFKDIDVFVHAAFSHIPGRFRGGEGDDPEGFRHVNLMGSRRLFEEARKAGVGRCLFLSSRAVYGGQPPGCVLTEHDTLRNPESLYGQVKLDAERALFSMTDEGFTTICLRPTGVYGASPRHTHKWWTLFSDYLAGHRVADRVGTEVHGSDLATAIGLLIDADLSLVTGQAFNVSDILTSHREILSHLAEATGCHNPLPVPMDASAFNTMDISRLRQLGWRPGGRDLLRTTIADLAQGLMLPSGS